MSAGTGGMQKSSARLLKLLALLQSGREWTGSGLSERLGINVRTVRRDIDRLRELGYQISSSSGLGGGYRLEPGAVMPPLRLDDDEAVALAVAVGGMAVTAPELQGVGAGLLAKLEQILPARLRERASSLHRVTLPMRGPPPVDPHVLTTVASACRACRRLEFAYRDRDGAKTTRSVEPSRLAHTGRLWYLAAWDVDRGDWRTFRVDRMERDDMALGERFVPRDLPEDVATYMSRALAVAPYEHAIRLEFDKPVEALAHAVPEWVGVLEPLDAGRCTITIGASSAAAAVAQLAFVDADYTLVAPPELADAIRRISRSLSKRVASA